MKQENSDAGFASSRIKHHKAALEMAMDRIRSSEDPFIVSFSARVLAAQSAEIDELQRWLASRQEA